MRNQGMYKPTKDDKRSEEQAKEARIQLYIARQSKGLNIFTGEPITAKDLEVVEIDGDED